MNAEGMKYELLRRLSQAARDARKPPHSAEITIVPSRSLAPRRSSVFSTRRRHEAVVHTVTQADGPALCGSSPRSEPFERFESEESQAEPEHGRGELTQGEARGA